MLAVAGAVDVWLVWTDLPASEVARLRDTLDPTEAARAAALAGTAVDRFVVAHGITRAIAGRYLDVAPERLRWALGRHGKPAATLDAPARSRGPGEADGADGSGRAPGEQSGLPASIGLEVNLSHSGPLAAVAVTRGRGVGVDVQRLAPRLDPVAMSRRWFPAAEAEFVAGGAGPGVRLDRFTRLWARKEACLKAAGARLVDGMRLPVRGALDSLPGRRCGVNALAAWRGLVVGDPSGTLVDRFRVRDLPAPAGFRGAVALVGDRPFAVRVRWWPGARPPHPPDALPRPPTPAGA